MILNQHICNGVTYQYILLVPWEPKFLRMDGIIFGDINWVKNTILSCDILKWKFLQSKKRVYITNKCLLSTQTMEQKVIWKEWGIDSTKFSAIINNFQYSHLNMEGSGEFRIGNTCHFDIVLHNTVMARLISDQTTHSCMSNWIFLWIHEDNRPC